MIHDSEWCVSSAPQLLGNYCDLGFPLLIAKRGSFNRMSRCFPFPPPGYVKKLKTDALELSELSAKDEKSKDKKEKKEKKDKEKKDKEKKDKEKKDKDRKEKERSKDKHKKRDHSDKNKDKASTSDVVKGGAKESTSDEKKVADKHLRQLCSNNDTKTGDKERPKSDATMVEKHKLKVNEVHDKADESYTLKDNTKDELRVKNKSKDELRVGDKEKLLEQKIGSKEEFRNHDKDGTRFEVNKRGQVQDQDDKKVLNSLNKEKNSEQKREEKKKEKSKEEREEKKNRDKDHEKVKKEGEKEKIKEKDRDKEILNSKEQLKQKSGDRDRGKEKDDNKDSGKEKDGDLEQKNGVKDTRKEKNVDLDRQREKDKDGNVTKQLKSNYNDKGSVNHMELAKLDDTVSRKRKDIDSNGDSHDNYKRSSKVLRSAADSIIQNGRSGHGIKDPVIPSASEMNNDETNHTMESCINISRGKETNGKLENQLSPISTKSQLTSQTEVGCNGPLRDSPENDGQDSTSLINFPVQEPWSDFDDQSWLFGNNNSDTKPKAVAMEIDKPDTRVWSEAVHIDSVDIHALPFVIPY